MGKRNFEKNSALLKKVGERIRKERVFRGLSQFQLADKADIGRSRLQKIEYGQSDFQITTLIAIAQALEMELSELLSFSVSEKEK